MRLLLEHMLNLLSICFCRHRDSHPFVCVVMLSDASHMVGGETELECGDGSSVKVKAPQMVLNR